jgi:WD40 repeat protein
MVKRLAIHKGRVEALAFSAHDKYLVSLGGPDDNSVVVWDLAKGAAICGTTASKDSSGLTTCLATFNQDDEHFATGGQQVMRVWKIDAERKKCTAGDCQLGQVKRILKSITVDDADQFMYCGTTTGDLLEVDLSHLIFKHLGPPKAKV